jgi:iron(III) transport system permease protein
VAAPPIAVAAVRRRLSALGQEAWITSVVGLAVGAMVLVPILVLVYSSFREADRFGFSSTWSLANYRRFIEDIRLWRAFLNTLVISTGVTLLAGALGLSLAWINARTNTPGRRLLEPLNLVPFFLSPFVGAIAWRGLAAPRIGLLNALLKDGLGLGTEPLNVHNHLGIIWVTALFFTPLMYLFVVGTLRRMDPALEDSARVTGARLWRTTLTVTLPLATPGILSGAIIIFVTSAGEFGVPFALGTPFGIETLTTRIYTHAVGDDANYNLGATLSVVLAVITVIFVYIQRRIIAPREFTTVTGKGFRPNLIDLGAWRWAALGYNLLYILLAVVLPVLALVAISLFRVWEARIIPEKMTGFNYWHVWSFLPARNGLKNSLILAAVGATVGMGLAIVVAYLIHRTQRAGRAALDFLSTLPIGFPGIVLAMGILITYIRTPLYATLGIILLGYVTRYMPYGQRSVGAILLAVSAELDQSSRMSGASWVTTLRRITLPLLRPGLLAGWLLLFIIYLRELPISLLLYKGGTEVLSVGVWYLLEYEGVSLTATLSVVQTALLLLCVFLFRRLAGPEALAT